MSALLSMQGIKKQFSGVHALKGVDFSLKDSQIHALVGENGAGKSTLMKILAGIIFMDAGRITYAGTPFEPKSPRHVIDTGIGIIHQELTLMDHLTVGQNVFIGQESLQKNGIFLDEKAQNARARALFEKLHIDLDPLAVVGKLTVGKQQMVEIAKAVSLNLRILVLDEPTATLTTAEVDELFRIMRDLQSHGVAMIHISHRLEEIHLIAERVTVLRDGERVGSANTGDISRAEIIKMMVGRTIYEGVKETTAMARDAKTILRVRKLCAGRLVRNISFDLKQGEILGFAGLIGAGRTETLRAVFGADPIESGAVEIQGESVFIRSPQDAVGHGLGYLSEDRKKYGLALNLSLRDNVLMASYDTVAKGLFINDAKARKSANHYVKTLQIKTPSVDQYVKNLSGGNQQKVVLARWLLHHSAIFIFDEPTRGIDVGAKSEIYTLMHNLAERGCSIIMISSELPEILRMSDRIIVMNNGEISAELDIREASQEKIMHYATGVQGRPSRG